MIALLKKIIVLLVPESLRLRLLYRGNAYIAEKNRRVQRKNYWNFIMGNREKIFRGIGNFAFINRPIEGYYMEFGCCGANTFRMAWDIFSPQFKWDFLAFDSFEGFPEIQKIDEQEIWKKGKSKMELENFKSTIEKHGVERTRIFPGFYEDSLTPALQSELLVKKAAVIYVDCDLYTSTVTVLNWVLPFLQKGTVIAFDEWNAYWGDPAKGERKAFAEFTEAHPEWHFEPFIANQMQKAFICVPRA